MEKEILDKLETESVEKERLKREPVEKERLDKLDTESMEKERLERLETREETFVMVKEEAMELLGQELVEVLELKMLETQEKLLEMPEQTEDVDQCQKRQAAEEKGKRKWLPESILSVFYTALMLMLGLVFFMNYMYVEPQMTRTANNQTVSPRVMTRQSAWTAHHRLNDVSPNVIEEMQIIQSRTAHCLSSTNITQGYRRRWSCMDCTSSSKMMSVQTL